MKHNEIFIKYAAERRAWTKVQGAQETNEASKNTNNSCETRVPVRDLRSASNPDQLQCVMPTGLFFTVTLFLLGLPAG